MVPGIQGGRELLDSFRLGRGEVVVFADDSINALLNKSPSLAAEIGDAIEARRQAAEAVRRRPLSS